MKKLMIAAAIVCAAALSQAATISWGESELYDPGTSELAADNITMTTFYFGTDATAGNAYNYILSLGEVDGQKFIYNNTKDGVLSFTVADGEYAGAYNFSAKDTGIPFEEGAGFSTTVKDVVSGTTYYFASIIEYAENAGDDASMYIANVGAETSNGKTKYYDGMGTTWGGENGTEAVEWQSVPEPTSGLLLLLGVAGLALRRRRA